MAHLLLELSEQLYCLLFSKSQRSQAIENFCWAFIKELLPIEETSILWKVSLLQWFTYLPIVQPKSQCKQADEKWWHNSFFGEFLAQAGAGKHLIFIYAKIIEYKNVGSTKVPL